MNNIHKLEIGTPYFYLAKKSTESNKNFILYIAMLLSETQSINLVGLEIPDEHETLQLNLAITGTVNEQDRPIIQYKRIPFNFPDFPNLLERDMDQEDLIVQHNEFSKSRIKVKVQQSALSIDGQEFIFQLPENGTDLDSSDDEISYNSPYLHVSKHGTPETTCIRAFIPLKGYRYDPLCQNITVSRSNQPLVVEVALQEDVLHGGAAILPTIHVRPDQSIRVRRSFQIKASIGAAKAKSRTMNADEL